MPKQQSTIGRHQRNTSPLWHSLWLPRREEHGEDKTCEGLSRPHSITVYPVQDSAKGQTPRTTETRKRDAVSGRSRLKPAGTCGFISPTQGGCSGWEPGLTLMLVFKGLMEPGLIGDY